MDTKILKLTVTVSVALMFSLIAFNNMIDYCTNFKLVKMVVSMESISTENVQWRAITSPLLQHSIYLGIITWESLTAIVCWIGALLMFKDKGSVQGYARGKRIAITGLAMGFALFMIGFVVIAGEWFYLWDSLLQSMHAKAILFSLLLASFAYFVSQVDDRKRAGENSYGLNLDHFSTYLHHNRQ